MNSDQSPLRDATPCVVRSVRPVREQGSRGGVWGDWGQTKPNHQTLALALVTANLSYVELGQSAQVRGSDAACPFLSEMFSFVKTITENDA